MVLYIDDGNHRVVFHINDGNHRYVLSYIVNGYHRYVFSYHRFEAHSMATIGIK